MPVVCDFQVIQGDVNRRIGDGASLWKKTFSLFGYNGGKAILMLMVKGLTATDTTVDVKINDKSVGKIFNYNGAPRNHWFTQIINIGSGYLNDGSNELEIMAVSWPGASPGNIFDDFYVRDVVCIFKETA